MRIAFFAEQAGLSPTSGARIDLLDLAGMLVDMRLSKNGLTKRLERWRAERF